MDKITQSEFELHLACADYLRLLERQGKINAPGKPLVSHIANGEKRDGKTGAKLKQMFMQPGWPDFLILAPDTDNSPPPALLMNWTNVYGIELKSEKGKQSPAQASFEAMLRGVYGQYAIARTFDEFRGILDGVLGIKEPSFGKRS